jgi:hypothetical protein
MHGVLGVFAMIMAMTRGLRRVGMARFFRRSAECSSRKSADVRRLKALVA